MTLTYDRPIEISVRINRKDMNLKQKEMLISEFYEKLREPIRGHETQAEYMALKKAQQDELKDVGGFVGGTLNGGRRKAVAVTGRVIVTLDADMIAAYGSNAFIQSTDSMPMYVTYSDLIQIGIFIVALVGLCYTIFGRKK